MESRPLGAIDPNSVRAPTPEGQQPTLWPVDAHVSQQLHLSAVARFSDSCCIFRQTNQTFSVFFFR